MNDYFLHNKCGYSFDKHGIISELTPEEIQRLWIGSSLWSQEVENADPNESDPKQKAKQADRREFADFAEKVNSNGNGQAAGA